MNHEAQAAASAVRGWTFLLALFAGGFAFPAAADTKTATFGVFAVVTHACNVSTSAPGLLSATCTLGSGFTIYLSARPQARTTTYEGIPAGPTSAAMGLYRETIIATIDF